MAYGQMHSLMKIPAELWKCGVMIQKLRDVYHHMLICLLISSLCADNIDCILIGQGRNSHESKLHSQLVQPGAY